MSFICAVNGSETSWTLLVNVLMAVIALASAIFAYLTYNHQKNRSKKAEACKLAAHYAEVILDKHAFISNVYKNSGIDQYIRDSIAMKDIKDFDRYVYVMSCK